MAWRTVCKPDSACVLAAAQAVDLPLPHQRVVLAHDDRMMLHTPGEYETPSRIAAVVQQLKASRLMASCHCIPAREASLPELQSCHSLQLIQEMNRLCEEMAYSEEPATELRKIDKDTCANQHTAQCAKLAAGACADVATAVARSVNRLQTMCIFV